VEEVALPITLLYFWSFVIIAYLLLFNMVLAVIFTVYDAAYSGMKHELKVEGEEKEKERQAEELMKKEEEYKKK
jgi:hypothetical protein